MVGLLRPFMHIIANSGLNSTISALKNHLILWVLAFIACIFALLFLNVVFYLALAAKIGGIYAGGILFFTWLLLLIFAITWARSVLVKARARNSARISSVISQQRQHLLPIALSVLPILRHRRTIFTSLGAVLLGSGATALTKLLRKRHKYYK